MQSTRFTSKMATATETTFIFTDEPKALFPSALTSTLYHFNPLVCEVFQHHSTVDSSQMFTVIDSD